MPRFANNLIYKDLYSVVIDPNPRPRDLKNMIIVVGSLIFDESKLTPVLKQLDAITIVPFLMKTICTTQDMETLTLAVWALSNFAPIKRYAVPEFLLDSGFI